MSKQALRSLNCDQRATHSLELDAGKKNSNFLKEKVEF